MPAPVASYQAVEQRMLTITAEADLRSTSVRRLALLVTGIIAAKAFGNDSFQSQPYCIT